MNPSTLVHRVIARVPAGVLVLAAAAGFLFLTRGMSAGTAPVTGYADAQVHSIAPLQGGRIKALPVHLGQPVRAGQIVAVLDSGPLELQRVRLQAELRQAAAQLLAERDIQESSLQRGELQVVRMNSSAERARAELHALDRQLGRMAGLRAQQLIRASEVEAVQRRREAAAAEVQFHDAAATGDREGLGRKARSGTEQNQRLERRMEPFRAAVQVREAALRELERAIDELTLRAPVDGSVGVLPHRIGEVVAAGAEVVSLVSVRPGRVVAFVPERLARGLSLGQVLRLRRTGVIGQALHARVIELSPLVDEVPPRARPSPTVPAWARRAVVQIEGDTTLLPGETFHVSL